MKSLIVLLAICTLGYGIDHWQELSTHRRATADSESQGLIIYGSKFYPACVQLENELNKRGIPYQKRDVSDEASFHELGDKMARVGKMGGRIAIPVAEINGVLFEGATIETISRKIH